MIFDSKVYFQTALEELVSFKEVALVNIKVTEGIGYKALFFLVKYTLITLLGQLFITVIKICFVYLKNSL